MGAEGYMVATALQAIIAQRLVPRICISCATEHPLEPREQAWVEGMLGGSVADVRFLHSAGCPHCNNTGYRGRIGVYEFLEMTQELTDALRRKDTAAFAHLAVQGSGFRSLAHSALDQRYLSKTCCRTIATSSRPAACSPTVWVMPTS